MLNVYGGGRNGGKVWLWKLLELARACWVVPVIELAQAPVGDSGWRSASVEPGAPLRESGRVDAAPIDYG